MLQSVAADPPRLPIDVVSQAVSEQFALAGDYAALISERDQNFRVTTAGGERFVVKIVGECESPEVTSFQIEALLHLDRKGLSGVPRVMLTRNGDKNGSVTTASGERYTLRVVSWVAGEPLETLPMNEQTATAFGRDLARLDIALSDFRHDGEQQSLLWDMQRAGELLQLSKHVTDRELRLIVVSVLQTFRDRTLPKVNCVRRQVIHNDANPSNVLLASGGQQVAFIDFGDMLRAPRAVEVATAAAYLRAQNSDVLADIAPFLAAYHAVNPLTTVEIECLYQLIQTRLCMTLVILYWRISTRDEDDEYRQKSIEDERDAAEYLRRLTAFGKVEFNRRIERDLAWASNSI